MRCLRSCDSCLTFGIFFPELGRFFFFLSWIEFLYLSDELFHFFLMSYDLVRIAFDLPVQLFDLLTSAQFTTLGKTDDCPYYLSFSTFTSSVHSRIDHSIGNIISIYPN